MPPPSKVVYLIVVENAGTFSDIVDLLTGKTQATLDQVAANTLAVLTQAQEIDTHAPSTSHSPAE